MSYLDRLRQYRDFSGKAQPGTDKTDKTRPAGSFVSFGSTPPGPSQKIDPPPALPPETHHAIAEALEERAAIREFEGGEPRPAAEREARSAMRVYDLLVAMGPGQDARWVTLLAPGLDLEEARRVAKLKFGAERLIEIRERSTWS